MPSYLIDENLMFSKEKMHIGLKMGKCAIS